jgi:OOP family OmpA-OmpF porin
VVKMLKNNPEIEIELSGHTDNTGSAKLNVELSQKRADRVKEYLIDKGIVEKRIDSKGYGGARPIASNKSEKTRRLNRRVEFTIIKN